MRLTAPSVLVLAMMTLAAMPPVSATHGDTAYIVGTDVPFLAESKYSHGPGYLDQYWDFALFTSANSVGVDKCIAMHGGWDPHPTLGGVSGFSGVCNSGIAFHTTGTNKYIPYPNPNGLAGPDDVTVTYGDTVIHGKLVVCDNGTGQLKRVSSSFCTDIFLLSTLI